MAEFSVSVSQLQSKADELEQLLHEHFGCETLRGFVDREHPEMEL